MTFAQSQKLRFYSMLGVVLIHATGRDEILFQKNHSYFSPEFFSVLLNQLSRFCVPMFVFLSGYSLAKKYAKEKPSYLRFFADRFLKIGIPFLFISFLTLAIQKNISLSLPLKENLKNFFLALTVKPADYHLYFFVIIWQCYILFPLLYQIKTHWLLWGLYLPLFFLTYPGILIFPIFNMKIISFPTAFFIYWIFYFYGGIYYAQKEKEISNYLKDIPLLYFLSLLCLSFFALIFEYNKRSYWESDPGYYNHFNRLSVQIYFAIFFFTYLRLSEGKKINETFWEKFQETSVGLSFFIYIFHPWLLRLLELSAFTGIILFFGVFLSTFLVGLALDSLIPEKNNFLRLVLALPTKSKKA